MHVNMKSATSHRSIIMGALAASAIVATVSFTAPWQTASAATSPLGSVRIQVVVVGGSAHASEFALKIKKSGPVDTGSVTGSGNTVIFSSLTPGSYTITSSGPSGYRGTWSGDCNSKGELSIGIGTEAKCTLTESYGTTGGGGGGGGGGTVPPEPERGSGRSDRSGSGRTSR